MPIIDAHIHFADRPGFARTARAAGHVNSVAHLQQTFADTGIVFAVAMGSGNGLQSGEVCAPMTVDLAGPLSLDPYNQPQEIGYCCGIESAALRAHTLQQTLDLFERHLQNPHCVGLKLYPGYNAFYPADPIHAPFYELAQAYGVPVVIHTGDTARASAHVKYAHPLAVDDAAVTYPKVQFVMAHYGNPWIVDATEVAKKNPNVAIDLSGLAEGQFARDWFLQTYAGYVSHLQTWMAYLSDPGKLMFGSDWPLVHLPTYVWLMQAIVPEAWHDAVFFQNAQRIFSRIPALLAPSGGAAPHPLP